MIQSTAIRLAGGEAHEHITDVRWRSASTSAGQSTRPAIVAVLAFAASALAAPVWGWSPRRGRLPFRPATVWAMTSI